MGLGALLGATLLSLLGWSVRYRWIAMLANFVRKCNGQLAPSVAEVRAQLVLHHPVPRRRIAVLTATVFLCYCLGVLLSYYFALIFTTTFARPAPSSLAHGRVSHFRYGTLPALPASNR